MFNINYSDLMRNKAPILEFAFKHSDCFSILATYQRPYSQRPPKFDNPSMTNKLEPYLERYIFDRNDWPVKYLSRKKHQVMIIYKTCRGSYDVICEFSDIFSANQSCAPEDLCFYRNNKVWFASISHEQIAYWADMTDADISFLKKHNIRFSD